MFTIFREYHPFGGPDQGIPTLVPPVRPVYAGAMRGLLLLGGLWAGLGLVGLAFAQPVYTWVGHNGVRHYSDVPHPGAKRVVLGGELSTFSVKPVRLGIMGRQGVVRPAAKRNVYRLAILSPTNRQSLFNIGGILTASVTLSPPLEGGDALRYLLDGKPQGGATQATSQVLHQVWRGTHVLTVEIVSAQGAVLETRSVTFYVHQHSILAPPPFGAAPSIRSAGPIKAIPH